MGFFSKSNKSSSENTGTTIIAEGTHMKGGIDTQGSVYIDGKFEGVISSESSIIIGTTGEFIGEIKSKSITVNGIVDGIINSDDIVILEEGKIIGKICYQSLSIEPNGVFEGEGKMRNSTLVSKYDQLNITQ
ncbi:MAG: polymer-forming cytoskeletal protein [Campylobacteraceae bacterium]|jgi:cytoskeletal protein CcmA (bactofilin family)|nr:polymer-forming cytoskeletal protein [Campylobacteraceae bacterium]MBT3881906.1 polymer-forming cytoskeletal protein [Campylobacteraceae bacterium]MBT4030772.1 polymer-forming cytoskeletal protein [Campylobacteraceae bacterium]MBT4178739.1 polymer-forming cytoskeletal protein [Campylobacteraceae bacterium]MBT4572102.1 polymer-forming cytoskeletal protein [Campylobacteraceae bacterium]